MPLRISTCKCQCQNIQKKSFLYGAWKGLFDIAQQKLHYQEHPSTKTNQLISASKRIWGESATRSACAVLKFQPCNRVTNLPQQLFFSLSRWQEWLWNKTKCATSQTKKVSNKFEIKKKWIEHTSWIRYVWSAHTTVDGSLRIGLKWRTSCDEQKRHTMEKLRDRCWHLPWTFSHIFTIIEANNSIIVK